MGVGVWKKNLFLKKAYRYGFNILRPVVFLAQSNSRDDVLPIIVNSFPKSGTHLLLQIINSFPNIIDRGQFLASTPSFSMKINSHAGMARRVNSLLNNEVASAHMFYSAEVSEAIASKNCLHYFIYRDPRDVCISEAYYLRYMNRWHRLHKYFREMDDIGKCIDLSIDGLPESICPAYPNITKRFEFYKGWLTDRNVHLVKFEDLVSISKHREIYNIVKYYTQKVGVNNVDQIASRAVLSIDSNSSHTFRKGDAYQWRSELSEAQKFRFSSIGEDLVRELNYAPTF